MYVLSAQRDEQRSDPARAAVGPIPPSAPPAVFVSFLYELLDAHLDTTCLVTESAPEQTWDAHLDYLCALQRLGRELLANIDSTT
jgi:hypothetical protein